MTRQKNENAEMMNMFENDDDNQNEQNYETYDNNDNIKIKNKNSMLLKINLFFLNLLFITMN